MKLVTLVQLPTASEGEVTYREAWHTESWNTDLLAFWEDFSDDGRLGPAGARRAADASIRMRGTRRPAEEVAAPSDAFLRGSLAVKISLAPGETRALTFLLT